MIKPTLSRNLLLLQSFIILALLNVSCTPKKEKPLIPLNKVERSLERSTPIIERDNKSVIESLKKEMMDSATNRRASHIFPKVILVQHHSDSVFIKIEKSLNKLTSGSNILTLIEGNDPVRDIFIKEKEAELIHSLLKEYVNNILSIDPAIDNTFRYELEIISDIFEDKEQWVKEYFENRSVSEVSTVLNWLLHDVRLSENRVLQYLYNKPSRGSIVYDD